MKQSLLLLLVTLLLGSGGFAQVVYEDFEGGDVLPWNGDFGDGTFNGAVMNPEDQDPLGINSSATVGSYTKSNEHAYSLLIAVLDEPIDLSVNNQLRIQVNAPVASQFILKLEGDGEAIERIANIAVTDTWIEYTFDFSDAAAFTTVNKFILFFDPGVTESEDTYLFDNLAAYPADDCAGTVPDPMIIDDFECQRNGTVAIPGLQDLAPVANPDPSGINTSSMVGEYMDGNGGEWHALVYDYHSTATFPIKEGREVLKIKVWAPVAGTLKFKLEGGVSSPFVEIDREVTELNTWVEYTADFSDQIAADHEKIVLFFNAGVVPQGDDIYYIDDLVVEAAPSAAALEDFEPQKLTWESLGGTDVFGSFDGMIANPDPSGANESDNVGAYTKGSSAFGGLKAQLPNGFTLADFPQLSLDVWAPAGGDVVVLKLFSPTQGFVDVTVNLTATESWATLDYSFEDYTSITDFERVEIQFGATGNSGTWYFDNLAQGESTVDPCAGVEPVMNIIDDFNCQRNAAILVGEEQLSIENNPVAGGVNPDPLDKVGAYTDPFDEWSALVYEFAEPIDLSVFNQLGAKIYASAEVPILFKLEGGTAAPVEVFADVVTTEEWVRYQIDFSGAMDTDHTRLAIFFNAGMIQTEELTYFVDDIEWARAPFTDCVINFETPELTVDQWTYFGNADLEGTDFMMADNPAPDAVNGSATVGVFQEAVGGEVWAGMYADPVAPMAMPVNEKTMTMKVWMDHAAPVVMKLEAGIDGAPNSGDVFADYTTPNEWAELTWDFSFLPDNALYGRVTIIMDIETVPENEIRTSYFDDISVAGASCQTSGVFEVTAPEKLTVMPNPATNWLRVETPEAVSYFQVVNMLGQPVQTIQLAGGINPTTEFPLGSLESGVYVLAAYDASGLLIGNAKFIKQ